jgi:hypothetical protein
MLSESDAFAAAYDVRRVTVSRDHPPCDGDTVSHVVMQAAEFPSVDLAVRCEEELRALVDAYVEFEATSSGPWGGKTVPPPLAAFGKAHGVDWPSDERSRFAIKGLFEEEATVLRVARVVFFWAGGFDLGGETLRAILRSLGATVVVGEGQCHLMTRHDDPTAWVEELAAFLDDEDFEDQFTAGDGAASDSYFSITVVGPSDTKHLAFDDSGVQDWAFVTVLPQLGGAGPSLLPG